MKGVGSAESQSDGAERGHESFLSQRAVMKIRGK